MSKYIRTFVVSKLNNIINPLKFTIMKQIYLVEQAMIFNHDEKQPIENWQWSVLYATSTKDEAKEDIKRNRRQEVQRKKTENNICYKCYYRMEEIELY